MSTAHINIGSNLGHRVMTINRAVSCLANRLGPILARSSMVESSPWGYNSPNGFINIGVNVQTAYSATEIVRILKEIEHEIAPEESHRDANGNYSDRTIDLDLICIDEQVSDNQDATVPHPRMHLREFVLRPLAELMPSWRHPRLKLTAAKILEDLCNNSSTEYVKNVVIE